MPFHQIAQWIALTLAALFAASALLHLGMPQWLRAGYRRLQFARTAGMMQFLAALFLAVPQTRIWGGVLGGMILFVTVVSLLNHRRYFYALPVMLVLMALAPAMA